MFYGTDHTNENSPRRTSRSIFCRHIHNASPSCSTDHTNENSPPRTSRSILYRHIHNASTIHHHLHQHHAHPRRHHHQRLHNIDMHGHRVGKVPNVSIVKISTTTRSVSDPEAQTCYGVLCWSILPKPRHSG